MRPCRWDKSIEINIDRPYFPQAAEKKLCSTMSKRNKYEMTGPLRTTQITGRNPGLVNAGKRRKDARYAMRVIVIEREAPDKDGGIV